MACDLASSVYGSVSHSRRPRSYAFAREALDPLDFLIPFRTFGSQLLRRVQHLADLAREGIRAKGFLEKRRARCEHPVMDDGVVRVARHI